MNKVHEKKMFKNEEGGVILEHDYQKNMQFSVLAGEDHDDALEEPDLYAYQRVPSPIYASDTYKVKGEIPNFNGNFHIEGCHDRLHEVEIFFEVMNILEDRRVPLVV